MQDDAAGRELQRTADVGNDVSRRLSSRLQFRGRQAGTRRAWVACEIGETQLPEGMHPEHEAVRPLVAELCSGGTDWPPALPL